MKLSHRTRNAAAAALSLLGLLGLLGLASSPALAFSGWGVSAPFHLDTSTGACCTSAGTCTITFRQGCPTPDIWQGAATTCNPANPCLSGACCLRSAPGTCQIHTQAECASYNGFYFGNGTLCAPSDTCLTTDVEGTSPSMRRLQLLVAPNPGADGVVIRCLLPQRTLTTLALFDASGRMVRRLHEGDLAAGETPFSWDGLDDAGQTLASGVYWARMETGAGRVVGKVVLAR